MDFVVDELFDGRRWFGGFGGDDGWVRLRHGRQECSEYLQGVDEAAGALGVKIVGGDAAQDLRGDGESGGSILDDGEMEGFGCVEVAKLAGVGLAGSGGVVEVAELLLAQGG